MKSSQYAQEFGAKDAAKVPGSDVYVYDRSVPVKREWKKMDLSTEKMSTYKRQYTGAEVSAGKMSTDKELRAAFKDRNTNIIGNSFASIEKVSHLKRSFVAPETIPVSNHGGQIGAHSRVSSDRNVAVKFPLGYRSALDGKSTYKDAFVDHQVKHCTC